MYNDDVIKSILKRNGISLYQFAGDLNISRPTLDSYIERYGSGDGEIPNQLFRDIFSFLFSDTTVTNEDFEEKYRYVMSYYGKRNMMSTSTDLPTIKEKPKQENILDRYNAYISGKVELSELTATDKKMIVAIHKTQAQIDSGDMSYDTDVYAEFSSAAHDSFLINHPDEKTAREREKLINSIKIMDEKQLEKLLDKIRDDDKN